MSAGTALRQRALIRWWIDGGEPPHGRTEIIAGMFGVAPHDLRGLERVVEGLTPAGLLRAAGPGVFDPDVASEEIPAPTVEELAAWSELADDAPAPQPRQMLLPYPDPPLRDGSVALRPFTLADGPWLTSLLARIAADNDLDPTAPLRLLGPFVTVPLRHLVVHPANLGDAAAKRVAEMWESGERATFIIDAADDPFGMVWVDRDGIVSGFRIPDPGERLPLGDDGHDAEISTLMESLAIARSVRLVFAWASGQPHICGRPRLALPCGNTEVVEWADRHGLEWAAAR